MKKFDENDFTKTALQLKKYSDRVASHADFLLVATPEKISEYALELKDALNEYYEFTANWNRVKKAQVTSLTE